MCLSLRHESFIPEVKMLFLISLAAGLILGTLIFALVLLTDRFFNHLNQSLLDYKFKKQSTKISGSSIMKQPNLI